MPNIGELGPRPYQRGELIDEDPELGRIACFCERATHGEIAAALREPDPAGRPRRPASAHPRVDGPLPGLLLRGRGGGGAGGWAGWLRTPSSSAAGPRASRPRSSCKRLGVESVTVIEREREAGGIPRHSDHTGFGARDLRRVMSGPRYARRYRELAEEAGVEVVRETMVTDWQGKGTLWLTGPDGRRRSRGPAAIVLATGCRERPRSARLVPGHARARGDDDQHPAAARLPARPPGHRQARGGRRRRARQLLGRRHPRPRRRLDPGAGDRAAAPPVAGGVPGGRAGPLPGAGLDPQPGDGDQRRPATGSRRSR